MISRPWNSTLGKSKQTNRYRDKSCTVEQKRPIRGTELDIKETQERFPNCKIINEWPDTALSNFILDEATHLVTLTHDPKIDDPALIYALRKDIGYIVSLGSKQPHNTRCKRLIDVGFCQSDLSKIHGPIGLNIKAKTPAEIAISIMAEIINFRRSKNEETQ